MTKRMRIRELEFEIKKLQKEKDELQKIVDGEKHKVGVQCIGCANLIETEEYKPFVGTYTARYCKLDCNCNDRVEKTE